MWRTARQAPSRPRPHASWAASARASAARAREGLSALLAQLDDGGVAPALPHIAVTEAGPLSLGVCAHHPHHPAVWLLLFGEGGGSLSAQTPFSERNLKDVTALGG